MTTNGSLLGRFAGELAEVGMRRIDVSLDTLDAETVACVTSCGDLASWLEASRSPASPVGVSSVTSQQSLIQQLPARESATETPSLGPVDIG